MSKTNTHKQNLQIQQLCSAKQFVMKDSKGIDINIITVNNGSGLSFDILIDRALDIGNCFYNNINIAYITKNEYLSPKHFNEGKSGFLDNFTGGLLTTCGLQNVGPSCIIDDVHFSMHGKVSNIVAKNVTIQKEWIDEEYVIVVSGVITEENQNGDKISLIRKITTKFNCNDIIIDDAIINNSSSKINVMFMYHFNFGYPLISESTKLIFPKGKIIPRDNEAKIGLSRYSIVEKPTLNYKEQVFFHKSIDLKSKVSILNNDNAIKVDLIYNSSQLPKLTQWKMMSISDYVIGIEPGLSEPNGREYALDKNETVSFDSLEMKEFKVTIKFFNQKDVLA